MTNSELWYWRVILGVGTLNLWLIYSMELWFGNYVEVAAGYFAGAIICAGALYGLRWQSSIKKALLISLLWFPVCSYVAVNPVWLAKQSRQQFKATAIGGSSVAH